LAVVLSVPALQPIRWQDSNPASNPAGKQASCAACLSFDYSLKLQDFLKSSNIIFIPLEFFT